MADPPQKLLIIQLQGYGHWNTPMIICPFGWPQGCYSTYLPIFSYSPTGFMQVSPPAPQAWFLPHQAAHFPPCLTLEEHKVSHSTGMDRFITQLCHMILEAAAMFPEATLTCCCHWKHGSRFWNCATWLCDELLCSASLTWSVQCCEKLRGLEALHHAAGVTVVSRGTCGVGFVLYSVASCRTAAHQKPHSYNMASRPRAVLFWDLLPHLKAWLGHPKWQKWERKLVDGGNWKQSLTLLRLCAGRNKAQNGLDWGGSLVNDDKDCCH